MFVYLCKLFTHIESEHILQRISILPQNKTQDTPDKQTDRQTFRFFMYLLDKRLVYVNVSGVCVCISLVMHYFKYGNVLCIHFWPMEELIQLLLLLFCRVVAAKPQTKLLPKIDSEL